MQSFRAFISRSALSAPVKPSASATISASRLQARANSTSTPSSPRTSSHHQDAGIWGFLRSMPEANENLAKEREKTKKVVSEPIRNRPPGPYAGRSVVVNRERPFQNAYIELQQVLRRNTVSYELRLAERHEKKGYKRRRLESDRHRRRFAHEVRKKVQLVNEIRARGA